MSNLNADRKSTEEQHGQSSSRTLHSSILKTKPLMSQISEAQSNLKRSVSSRLLSSSVRDNSQFEILRNDMSFQTNEQQRDSESPVATTPRPRLSPRPPSSTMDEHRPATRRIDLTQVEAAAQRHWYYKEPSGAEKGPYLSSEIVQFINEGRWDGKASTEFRAAAIVHRIARGQLGEIYKRLRQRAAEASPKEPEVSAEVCREFDIPFDITSLKTTGDPSTAVKGISPDVDIIVLPPRGTIPEQTLQNIFGIDEHGKLTLQQLESDYDWLQNINPAFAVWAQEHHIVGCQKALIFPAHVIVLKCSSPILLRAIEHQDREQRKRELDILRLHHEVTTAEAINRSFRIQFLIRVTNPEAFRAILRFLYGEENTFQPLEPTLLACIYFEARRLQMASVATEARRALNRMRSFDNLLVLAEVTELLELWDVFTEICDILANAIYLVLSGQRYLRLGPVGFHRILSSDSASIDEVQLFIAAHLWMTCRYQKDRLVSEDYWNLARKSVESTQELFSTRKSSETPLTSPTQVKQKTSTLLEPLGKKKPLKENTPPNEKKSACSSEDLFYGNKLREARITLGLDSLILDGCLRKLLKRELRGRCRLWTSNAYFDVEDNEGRFPLRLIRRTSSSLRPRSSRQRAWGCVSGRHDQNERSCYTPGHLHEFWAWSAGDPRPVSEACWAIQVITTKAGRIALGLASAEPHNVVPNVNIPVPRNGTIVWYFNLFSREFYTGVIGNDFRNVNFRLSMTPAGCPSWPRQLVHSKNIILLQVSVGATTLRMTLYLVTRDLHNPEAGVSFDFPHHTAQQYRGVVSGRPCARVAPWFELMDEGDTLAFPELRYENARCC